MPVYIKYFIRGFYKFIEWSVVRKKIHATSPRVYIYEAQVSIRNGVRGHDS